MTTLPLSSPAPARSARSAWLAATALVIGLLLGVWLATTDIDADAQDPARGIAAVVQGEFVHATRPVLATVALPHTWRRDGLPLNGQASYRLSFQLGSDVDAAGQPIGLFFKRISTIHRVEVNGVLVAAQEAGPRGANRGQPTPALMSVPPSVLRAGENTLTISVDARWRGGLSDVLVGDAGALQERYHSYLLRHITLPQGLNLAALGVALFMLIVWWRRRNEHTLGLFGALSLIGALRNYNYFLTGSVMPAAVTDWLFYAGQNLTVALLGGFALAFARVRWPIYRAGLWLVGLGLPVMGALGAPLDVLPVLRQYGYPLLFLVGFPALYLIAREAWSRGTYSTLALTGVMGALVVAGGHDYLYQQGWISVMHTFWLPYVMPVALGSLSLVMINRLVDAMDRVETLNAELEARVGERTQALQDANAAKSRFIATASHDLRQPVVTIGLLVGLVRQRLASPELRGLIDRVDAAVRSMEDLLRGLLDLSRLDSGQVTPRREAVDLQPLLSAIVTHAEPQATARGLRLRVRGQMVAVQSDPVMLERILRNLLSNAIRYTDRGGVLLAVRPRGPQVRIEVWDTGRGIAESDREAVFQEFVQAHGQAASSGRGIGLGLSIVRRLAGLLGHPITLRSVLGRGTCFSVTVPRVDRVGTGGAPPVQPATHARALVGRHVVLVEDETPVREAMAAQFRAWGMTVEEHPDVDALRAALQRGGPVPDMVVSDLQLPRGDGLAAIAALRDRHGAGLPALVVTGETLGAELAILRDAGLAVLHKPFRAEVLRLRMADLLSRPPVAVDRPG